jgi:large subunit ribosomal protein L22
MQINSSARLRFVSVPPRKMRQVAQHLKGMPVQKALDTLSFTPRVAARHIANTVKSAAANALSQEGTDRLRPEDLYIKDIFVDAAPTAKRIRFRSMGRVYRLRKRFCHLTVRLEGEMESEEAARRRKARGRKAAEETEGRKTRKGKAASGKKKAAGKTDGEKAPEATEPAEETSAAVAAEEEVEAPEATEAAATTETTEESPEEAAGPTEEVSEEAAEEKPGADEKPDEDKKE